MSDVEKEEIVKAYLNGESCEKISNKYNCGSQYISDLLRQLNVKIRTHQECVQQQQKNIYYRLDSKSLEVLEKYKSFAQIGKWAQENNLTDNANASTAGLATRYAMLFGTEVYGYKWDSSWTEKEKDKLRQSFKKSSKKNRDKGFAQRTDIPSRKELKKDLIKLTRKDILNKYSISSGCLDNWKFFYCLDAKGNDTDGWENAPEQYLRSSKPTPSYDELALSLHYDTINEAADKFGVPISSYKNWLKKAGLPYTKTSIDAFLQKPKKTKQTKKNHQNKTKYPTLSYEKLKESLLKYDTMKDAYLDLGLSEFSYKKQLKIANLPSTSDEINEFRKQNGYDIQKPSYSNIRPERNILKDLIRNKNFSLIGRQFGVRDNTIRKWCRYYNLPDASRIIKQIADEDWDYACEHWDEVKQNYRKHQAGYAVTDAEKAKIELYHMQGRTIKDIAKSINRSVDTVSNILKEPGYYINPNASSKSVRCIELDVTTNSIVDMAKYLIDNNIAISSNIDNVAKMIRRCLKNSSSYRNLHFQEIK